MQSLDWLLSATGSRTPAAAGRQAGYTECNPSEDNSKREWWWRSWKNAWDIRSSKTQGQRITQLFRLEGPLEGICFNSQWLGGSGRGAGDNLPSSKQAQLKLLGAFVIQNTCFVGGIHQAVGGIQPVHGGRNTSSNKNDLKIKSGLFWDFWNIFSSWLTEPRASVRF